MSTHSICFYEVIRKVVHGYPLLPGTMIISWSWRALSDILYLSVKGNGYTFMGGNSVKITFASLLKRNLQ